MLYRFCIWAKNGKLLPNAFWSLYWHCSCSSKPRIHSGYMALNFWCADFRLALFWEGSLLYNFWDKAYADKPFWTMYAVAELTFVLWLLMVLISALRLNFGLKSEFYAACKDRILNEILIWKKIKKLHKFTLILILYSHSTFPTKSLLRPCGYLFLFNHFCTQFYNFLLKTKTL